MRAVLILERHVVAGVDLGNKLVYHWFVSDSVSLKVLIVPVDYLIDLVIYCFFTV